MYVLPSDTDKSAKFSSSANHQCGDSMIIGKDFVDEVNIYPILGDNVF